MNQPSTSVENLLDQQIGYYPARASEYDQWNDVEILPRRLNDGRQFQVYKIFYEPDVPAKRLESLGWNAEIRATSRYFWYCNACPDR